MNSENYKLIDVILVGGGIMSATFGTLLKILEPNWSIYIFERLKSVAQESSSCWNNSGTGHAAFCELNYTPYINKEYIDISKAILINKNFKISYQFWSYLTKKNILSKTDRFFRKMPHISFVSGKEDIEFLHKRFCAMQNNSLFQGMIYSDDTNKISQWIPLIMYGRNKLQKVAATYVEEGSDINFGEITKQMFNFLIKHPNFNIFLNHEVFNLNKNYDNTWSIYVKNLNLNNEFRLYSRYVFIGAGGASLKLLQKSSIPESKKYAGFPISGKFLVTFNPNIVNKHYAKVYGKNNINCSIISMPHIDTRILDGQLALLFGPFAELSSKFLKYGSYLDLFKSINKKNVFSIIKVILSNLDLTKYVIKQSFMSYKDYFNILKEYYPTANIKDWNIIKAGQRVQIIKQDSHQGSVLKFGNEVVCSSDGSLSALLGASPGASSSVSIILDTFKIMFKEHFKSKLWQNKIKKMLPLYF